MRRMRLALAGGAFALIAAVSAIEPSLETTLPAAAVLPGHALEFPRDYGSHPQFGI